MRRTTTTAIALSLAGGLLVPGTAASADRLISDSMTRVVSTGMGAAPLGGGYLLDEPEHFRVDGRRARVVVTPGNDRKALLPPGSRDSSSRFTFSVSSLPAKGRSIVALRARAGQGDEYRLRVRIKRKGRAHLTVGRFLTSGRAAYEVGRAVRLPFRIRAGRSYVVRASVKGATPVALKMKAWPSGTRQPRWQLRARDHRSQRVTAPGRLGFLAYVTPNGRTTQFTFDSFRANGVPVQLTQPTPPPPTTTAPAPPPSTPAPPSPATAGAHLPSTSPLPGSTSTVVHVAPSGDDQASGTLAQPLRTLGAALARVRSAPDPVIVVRGGLYREGRFTVPDGVGVRVQAYPGEIPEFRGSTPFVDGWTTEGTLSHHAYTPQPVTNGGGISFTSGQNLTGSGVGKHPDQVWVADVRLRQVTSKDAVGPGTFWVDAAAGRVYLSSSDVAKGGVEASSLDVFATIRGNGTVLEGIRVSRFSNSADDQGVIRLLPRAANTVLRNVEVLDASFQAVSMAGRLSSSGLLRGVTLENVTIAGANWMGITTTLVDDLTLRRVLVHELNEAREFRMAPASGAIKATRTRGALVEDSVFRDTVGHGVWFDQSSAHVTIAGNDFSGITGASVFFEISDDLLLVNNVVRSTGQRVAKLAGASGLKLVNNTLVGAADPVGIYVDSRSRPGCADPSQPLCEGSYSSDRDPVRPRLATMDWIPRLDLMINNVLAHPTKRGYCGATTTLCIMDRNGSAYVPIQTVIHQADPARGIPQTRIDGNVYASGSGPVAALNGVGSFTTHTDLAAALAARPVSIPGQESSGRSGSSWVNADGTPSALLASVHQQAVPIPSDPQINAYLPAGLRRYGAIR